ncbi:hypothetical protein [Spiroplasma endosymbiont of Cantharis rufa]|uniref:hypothetical protein n=1 Tax=Spiroplasma endosymbiont of Cantharis rufa TaxID=3066279 RepID=UPI0030D089E2
METINKKYYVLIGNEVYNLFQVEDEFLNLSRKTLSNEKLKNTKIPKINSSWKATNWYFLIEKAKIQDPFIK